MKLSYQIRPLLRLTLLFVFTNSIVSFAKSKSIVEFSNFAELFKEAELNGPCKVKRVRFNSSTFYVPANSKNPNMRYNILGWGNGSAMSANTYSKVLESIASHCIFVAAANTSAAGSGKEIQNSVDSAISQYPKLITAQPKICTSGHSQGGGGSMNAANRLNADCVITIQADTLYTSKINHPLARDVEVISLWSSSDTISPANPTNFKSIDQNSSILTSIETYKENHFTITSKRGGNIGTLFRMAALAQLSVDITMATKFRKAFWGPNTTSTATAILNQISEVDRDSGALNAIP